MALLLSFFKRTSIFQAEIYAIDRCFQINYTNCDIAVMSDSQAAIMALDSYVIKSKLVSECLQKLKELSRRNRVKLCWIPGHTGEEGNEMANSLARKGALEPFMGPQRRIQGIRKEKPNRRLERSSLY